MNAAPSKFGIGQAVRRVEDQRFTTGSGQFVGDLALPRQCYGVAVLSPHAHAIITGVDLSAAKAAAGVRLALAGADLPRKIGSIKPNWVIPGTMVPDRPVIAIDRVLLSANASHSLSPRRVRRPATHWSLLMLSMNRCLP